MNYAVWRFSSAGPASGRRVFLKFSACSPSYYFRMTGPTRRASQKQPKMNKSLRTRINAQAFLHERPNENVTRRTRPKPTKASEDESESKVHSEVLICLVFFVLFALSFWRFWRFRENLSDRHRRMLYIWYVVFCVAAVLPIGLVNGTTCFITGLYGGFSLPIAKQKRLLFSVSK